MLVSITYGCWEPETQLLWIPDEMDVEVEYELYRQGVKDNDQPVHGYGNFYSFADWLRRRGARDTNTSEICRFYIDDDNNLEREVD